MAAWLKSEMADIEQILVSPYLRAEQTECVVAEALNFCGKKEVLPELTPGGDADRVADYLQMLATEGVSSVLIISHLPLVGYIVSALCPEESPPMFSTSAIACVTLDASTGKGRLNWQKSPCQFKTEKMGS